MNLAELITRDASAAATAGDWAAVAAILNAATVQKTSAGTLTSMARTLASLADSEREATLAAFQTTHVGKSGLAKLAATGLDFAHPITIGLIESLRNTLPSGVADKLLRLGNWTVSPAADAGFGVVTANACEVAWELQLCDQAWATVSNEVIQPELSNPSRTKASLATKLRAAATAVEA